MVGRRRHLTITFIFAFILSLSQTSSADVLFEGYFKILSGGTHAGYSISRYEFDAKKKQFIATTFLKTGELGGSLTESLKAYASEDLKPISYQYTTLIKNITKTVDAKFEKGKMIATVKDGAKVEKINVDLPKGVFLSTFLAYLMLKSKEGIKPDTKYDYQAIAEEDGKISKGLAFIKGKEDFNGMSAFRVINEFKGAKFTSYINERGEVYSVKSPAQSISQELVPQPSLATGQFQIPTSLLKVLFGEVPTGQINEVAKAAQNKKAAEIQSTPIPGKQYGVPGGKGILIKTQPEGAAAETAPAATPATKTETKEAPPKGQ